jgi:hypothetical protein
LKSVSETCYIVQNQPQTAAKKLTENFAMTTEILYLTARIHHWLNLRVARHLAAQAAKFTR